jgi:hypothetical protein
MFDSLYKTVTEIVDAHIPITQMSKGQLKCQSKGIQSKRPQVKTSPNLHSQNVPRPKRPQGEKPLNLVFK